MLPDINVIIKRSKEMAKANDERQRAWNIEKVKNLTKMLGERICEAAERGEFSIDFFIENSCISKMKKIVKQSKYKIKRYSNDFYYCWYKISWK